jgi:hypothetical protein
MPRKKSNRTKMVATAPASPTTMPEVTPTAVMTRIDAQTHAQLVADFERYAMAQVQKKLGATVDAQGQMTLVTDPKTGIERFVALTHDAERAERWKAAADRGTQLEVFHIDPPSEDALARHARIRFGAGSPLAPSLSASAPALELPERSIESAGIEHRVAAESPTTDTWRVRVKPGQAVAIGAVIHHPDGRAGRITRVHDSGARVDVELLEGEE